MEIDGISSYNDDVFYTYDKDCDIDLIKDTDLNYYSSSWLFMQGKIIKLSFLGFGSKEELVRACKNIRTHVSPDYLSQPNAVINTSMKDGSMEVTFRPPLSSSWALAIER